VKTKGLVLLAVLMVARGALADACPDKCAARMKQWDDLEASRKKNSDLLGKNYSFLASISAGQASKFLKANSNRVIILRMLDDIKKQQDQLKIEITKEGCEPCLSTLKKEPEEISED
jgi:hypothetical protein